MTAECKLCGESGVNRTLGTGRVCENCYHDFTHRARPQTPSSNIDSPEIESDIFPENFKGWSSWISWVDAGRKQPYAAWGPRDHPDKPDTDARYSWSLPGNWTDFETVQDWVRKDPQLETPGFVFQKPDEPYGDEADPFFAVDYDDVRNPDTGEIHPVVAEHIERAGTYADVSTSGTGIHVIGRGSLPEGVGAIHAELAENEQFPNAAIEVYDGKRFMAMTGDHIVGTPTEATDCQGFIEELIEEFNVDPVLTTPGALREPEKSRDVIGEIETTDDIQDVFDAIHHTGPGDIWLRSSVTRERPNGDLDLDPSWTASESGTRLGQVGDGWIYRQGDIGLDALQVVALEEGIINTAGDYPRGDAFWRAVDALRERGAHVPSYDGLTSAEGETSAPVAAFPLKQLAQLKPHDRKRFARKRSLDIPSTEQVRERLAETIDEGMRSGRNVVIDAPTGSGKSYHVAATPWLEREGVTGGQPVVMLSETTEARNQAVEKSRDADIDYRVLQSRREACSVCAGEHDPGSVEEYEDDRQVITMNGEPASAWMDQQCDRKGIPVSVAHHYLHEHNDQGVPLPCKPPTETGFELCTVESQWAGVPRREEAGETVPAADVIHATHQFALVPSLRVSSNLVFDEQPDFSVDLSQDRIQRAITSFLKVVDAPVRTWEAFIQVARSDSSRDTDLGRERSATWSAIEKHPPRIWYLENHDAHTLAPALARAIFHAEGERNGRRAKTVSFEPPRLDAAARADDGWNRVWVTVVIDASNRIRTVRQVPDLSQARSVVGLDARPARPLWQRNTRPDIDFDVVLLPEERQLWRRFERQLVVVQVGEATRPYASGRYFDEAGTHAVLEALQIEYGQDFRTVITAAAVEDRTRQLLEEAGVRNPRTMHFGEEKSRDDFAGERVGLVNGCIDPGDDYVLDILAELQLDATPETVDTVDGQRRAHGRGFVGPDAETASAILASVRENHVAQAVGRYARDADNPDDQAVVYVRTDAIPVGLADYQVPGVVWLFGEKQRDVVEAVRAQPGATAREVAEAVGCSKEHVRRTLAELQEEGIVSCRKGIGPYGANVYGARSSPNAGIVNIDIEGIADPDVWDSYTWELAIRERGTPAGNGVVRPDLVATTKDVNRISTQVSLGGYPPG